MFAVRMLSLKTFRFTLAICMALTFNVFVTNTSGAVDMWKFTEPIVTYFAGPPVFGGPLTDQRALQMKEGGWNLIWCYEKDLDTAQKFGLKAELHDPLLNPYSTLDEAEQMAQLTELVKRVRNHPALHSYHITDEPNSAIFPKLAKIMQLLKEHDPARLGYINLFPCYATAEQLGNPGDTVTAYRAHLEQYITEVKPLLLSYDHYHYSINGDGGEYFLNLAMVREAAVKHKLPFMNIVQACSWIPPVRIPNADELRFLYYTTLAYGGQAISQYVYSCPGHEGMMVNLDGTPTRLYHAAKVYNDEFYKIASELMELESVGAYHIGQIPAGAAVLPKGFSYKVEAEGLEEAKAKPLGDMEQVKGFVLGCFGKGSDKTPSHVLLVNLDYTKSVKATITAPKKLELFFTSTGTWEPANTKSIELDLLPGGGRLIRLEQN